MSDKTKCEQHGCIFDAVARMFWPSSPPMPVCQEHVNWARTISGAMDFHLHVEALPGFEEITIPPVSLVPEPGEYNERQIDEIATALTDPEQEGEGEPGEGT